MSTAAPEEPKTWSVSSKHVRQLLSYIKRKGGKVNAEDLVAWDRDHGRHLFDWDDAAAAEEWRLHQARLFLDRFRAKFEGMRVRAFIHIHKDEEAGIDDSGYLHVEDIAANPSMRDQVVSDLTRRMKTLASELKMWKLTSREQNRLFDELRNAMTGEA